MLLTLIYLQLTVNDPVASDTDEKCMCQRVTPRESAKASTATTQSEEKSNVHGRLQHALQKQSSFQG